MKTSSNEINHETNILVDLLHPWYNTDRVQTAEELLHHGLRFIGLVKIATRKYPMRFLSKFELESRGD
jgi:hypothetical protein